MENEKGVRVRNAFVVVCLSIGFIKIESFTAMLLLSG